MGATQGPLPALQAWEDLPHHPQGLLRFVTDHQIEKGAGKTRNSLILLVGPVGLEPTTNRL